MQRTIAERSADTQVLIDQLAGMQVGEQVEYAKLTKILGRDVTREAAGNLQSAKRACEREHSIVFGTLRRVGLVRLGDEGIVTAGRQSVTRVHREAARGLRRLACAEYDKLGNESKVSHNAIAAGLGALHAMTGAPAVKKLTAASAKANEKLKLASTLQLFGGGNGKHEE